MLARDAEVEMASPAEMLLAQAVAQLAKGEPMPPEWIQAAREMVARREMEE